jgi:hypothetical protein
MDCGLADDVVARGIPEETHKKRNHILGDCNGAEHFRRVVDALADLVEEDRERLIVAIWFICVMKIKNKLLDLERRLAGVDASRIGGDKLRKPRGERLETRFIEALHG